MKKITAFVVLGFAAASTFAAEGPAAVTVAAYDIAGRRVAASGMEAAAGANAFELDASFLAPGCHVAAVKAGEEESHASFATAR